MQPIKVPALSYPVVIAGDANAELPARARSIPAAFNAPDTACARGGSAKCGNASKHMSGAHRLPASSGDGARSQLAALGTIGRASARSPLGAKSSPPESTTVWLDTRAAALGSYDRTVDLGGKPSCGCFDDEPENCKCRSAGVEQGAKSACFCNEVRVLAPTKQGRADQIEPSRLGQRLAPPGDSMQHLFRAKAGETTVLQLSRQVTTGSLVSLRSQPGQLPPHIGRNPAWTRAFPDTRRALPPAPGTGTSAARPSPQPWVGGIFPMRVPSRSTLPGPTLDPDRCPALPRTFGDQYILLRGRGGGDWVSVPVPSGPSFSLGPEDLLSVGLATLTDGSDGSRRVSGNLGDVRYRIDPRRKVFLVGGDIRAGLEVEAPYLHLPHLECEFDHTEDIPEVNPFWALPRSTWTSVRVYDSGVASLNPGTRFIHRATDREAGLPHPLSWPGIALLLVQEIDKKLKREGRCRVGAARVRPVLRSPTAVESSEGGLAGDHLQVRFAINLSDNPEWYVDCDGAVARVDMRLGLRRVFGHLKTRRCRRTPPIEDNPCT